MDCRSVATRGPGGAGFGESPPTMAGAFCTGTLRRGLPSRQIDPKDRGKVQQMLSLLIRYHVMEQELAARYLSESH